MTLREGIHERLPASAVGDSGVQQEHVVHGVVRSGDVVGQPRGA